MDAINIAVVGTEGVGKSSFIQKALRLPRPPSTSVSVAQHEVDGTYYRLTVIELDVESVDVDPKRPMQWPKLMDGHMIPRVDGVLILYNVMNKDSARDLPPIISALAHSALPTMLVATKCDHPESLRQIDTSAMAAVFPSCLGNCKTSANVPASIKECLHALLRAVNRGDGPSAATSRRRAASAANLDAPADGKNGRTVSSQNKHNRASSELSLLRGFSPSPSESAPSRSQNSKSPRIGYPGALTGADLSDDGHPQTVSSLLRTPGVRLDGHESFLDIDESDTESYRYSDDVPILQRNDEAFSDRPAKVTGVTFGELVDRLLAPRLSKADNNFADIFLCLYRMFAPPLELFAAILARLDQVKEDKQTHYLSKTATQLRIVEVVAKWVASYPGDFARAATRKNLEDLIRHLATEPVFSMAAQQMRLNLQRVSEDDDTGWAESDDVEEDAARHSSSNRDATARSSADPLDSGMGSLRLEDQAELRRPSESSELSGAADQNGRTPARFQFHSLEDYEREAATMVLKNVLPMNKNRWHIFMDIDADDIADEMTRIDWVMFSAIRTRDFVRAVSLTPAQKERCRRLRNVDRTVDHFNHVARWVASMVLIRDKAKHRALCLEKFMTIALKLRQLNNYNGLAAVLAGINGTAVHRLAQTRALVSPDVQKRFARLGLLMGTQKSHFAYRLAWENSPLPRIPFLALHRRDLSGAEEGSRTFVGPAGDRINWRMFEVLGEVLLPIMKSQGTPYPNLNRHEGSRELILDCRTGEDEANYQRSVQVEATTSGALDAGKKKFPWLAK